jgi:hypothetical protein
MSCWNCGVRCFASFSEIGWCECPKPFGFVQGLIGVYENRLVNFSDMP